jgi:hypothetical protein
MALGSLYAGTSGRIALAAVVPDLTVDTVDFATVGATSVFAAISSWSINDGKGESKVVTFESAANSEGTVYPEPVRGGIGQWTARVDAVVGSSMTFIVGQFLVVDFIWKKGAPNKGLLRCGCSVKGFAPATSVNDQYAKYTLELDGYYALPSPTF